MDDTTRVTLVLPADLWENVKRLVPSGQRSKLVAEAIEVEIRRRQRIEQLSRLRSLRDKLVNKYQTLPDSAEDIQMMREERDLGEPGLH
jgi:uncharacterized coiled-coil DUF342 family protein